jgi:hypothetical protein
MIKRIKYMILVRKYKKLVRAHMREENKNTPCRQRDRRISRWCYKLRVHMRMSQYGRAVRWK